MQLDFFHRLIAAISAPKPDPNPAPAAPETARQSSPAAPSGEDAGLTAKARALLLAAGRRELAAKVRVRWNPRMRSTAGTAYLGRSLITLNPRLCEFGEEEVNRTFLHELAHLLAHDRAGRRRIAAHGREWQTACTDLGLEGETRCHTLPLPRRKLQRHHAYRCPACGVRLERVRPLRRRCACLACCRKHNRGRYDERFRLVKVEKQVSSKRVS